MRNPFRGLIAGGVAALACFTHLASAFDVPRHVFFFDRLAEAQQESYEDKDPLLILYTDPKAQPS